MLKFGFCITLGLIWGAAYLDRPRYEKPTKQETTTNNTNRDKEGFNYDAANLDLNRWDLRAQWVMAVGTLLLLGATLATLIYTVRATNKNLALTKRSVDAYMDSERGRLVLMDAYRMVGPSKDVGFRFRNVGKSELTIVGFAHAFQTVDKRSNKPVKPERMTYFAKEHILHPGEEFRSRLGALYPQSGHSMLKVPDDVFGEINPNRDLVCFFGFMYMTAFGERDAMFTYQIPHGPDSKPLAHYGKRLRYDNVKERNN